LCNNMWLLSSRNRLDLCWQSYQEHSVQVQTGMDGMGCPLRSHCILRVMTQFSGLVPLAGLGRPWQALAGLDGETWRGACHCLLHLLLM
jgi:hypothetical protein